MCISNNNDNENDKNNNHHINKDLIRVENSEDTNGILVAVTMIVEECQFHQSDSATLAARPFVLVR